MGPLPTTLSLLVFLAAGKTLFGQNVNQEQAVSTSSELTFLQQNFANFPQVSFLPPTSNSEAVIQSFKVRDDVIENLSGVAYTGVRFTLPDWLDGDLHWSFFHLNPESQKRQPVSLMWGICPEKGKVLQPSVRRIDPDDKNEFWRRYPFTRRVYSQVIPRTNLQAGLSYALHFTHFAPNPPDIAFAITIDSERGRKEFGSQSFISGTRGVSGLVGTTPRITTFLQEHWTNFPTVTFRPATPAGDSSFQDFKVSDHVIGEFDGQFYSGVRFTAPSWMDGDLEFVFVHKYRSKNELLRRPAYSWGITAEQGEFYGMGNVERVFFQGLPETQARFPFTEKGYMGTARREHFTPGKTYVLWWSHFWSQGKGVVPDLALAFTIDSDRGHREFGTITWR